MWQYSYYSDSSSLVYYLEDNPIIEIEENIFKLKHLKKFVAQVVPKEEFDKKKFTRHESYDLLDNELTDDDLEVLKFKSLLIAKELGWDVNVTDVS